MQFTQKGYYVNVYNIHNYLYNILKNKLVPKHEIIDENRKKEIAEEYNIVAESQWPEISRFDPAAMAIGLRPGQVVEITRKSPTALDTKYYRLCVDGGLK
ncbi:MAG: DNA-directed RNA polymerase subunit H [Flavobacteriaceae bacterium]|nr:DNA-directed RNA polymerase subunit H [Flavobacteriaceae bacterium]